MVVVKTYLDCIPCFLSQALRTSRIVTDDESVQRRIMDDVARLMPGIGLEMKPPEIAQQVYRIVYRHTDHPDPYRDIKRRSNETALALYPLMKRLAERAADPLLLACKLAIAGNVIDFGPRAVEGDMAAMVSVVPEMGLAVDHYADFRRSLESAGHLVILGDNAGEIVFDRFLIEQLLKTGDIDITYVVREKPIINDATRADAEAVGLAGLVRVISNGSDAPATILSQCNPETRSAFDSADLIVSKGQGNFESLSGEPGPLFFFLKAKCRVIAGPLNIRVGDAILMRNGDSIREG